MRIEQTLEDEPFNKTHAWLRDHNAQHATGEFVPLRLLAQGDEGDLLGSLDGVIFWGKLHIDNLVVDPARRGQGIGRRLMQQAERISVTKGCTGIYLETLSFQAIGFYLRLGYSKVGEITGFENGCSQCFLHKAIAAGRS